MDNLTHTMTGVLLARAGLDRLSPRAVWIAAIAANIPDADVISLAFGGTATYHMYHRWATHAIAFMPLVALVPVLVVAAVFRTRLPWFRAWLVSMVALASHLLLDFTNAYGIRLFLPFSDAWPSLDITNVVDLWIWLILLAGCLWPALSGLVGSEIGAKKKPRRGVAIAALLALTAYECGRFVLHAQAVATLESRVYDGATPRSAVVMAHFANPFRWEGWVETERAWLWLPVDLTGEFDPTPAATVYKGEMQRAIEVARKIRSFDVLQKFARTPLWRVSPAPDQPDAVLVELIDLRFGHDGRSGFTATAVIDKNDRVLTTGFHF